MAYAPADRAFYDADSHIMELPNFLLDYADPDVRDKIPPVNYSASIVTDEEVAEIMARGGRHSEAHVAELIAMGDKLIESSKEIQALGAFDSKERTIALDMLGFNASSCLQRKCCGALLAEFEDDAGGALRIGACTQPCHGRLLPQRRAPARRRCSAARRACARNRRTRARNQTRTQSCLGAAPPLRRQGARARGVRSVLGTARRSARAVSAACRWRPASVEQSVVEQRPSTDERLARRRRKRAQQRHRDPARRSRDVLEHDADRRRVRTLSRAARCKRGTRRRLGAVAADAPRLGGRALEQSGQESRELQTQAVGTAHGAMCVHAVRVRRRGLPDRSIERRSVSVFERLPAHRRRPQSDRTVRAFARRPFEHRSRQVLL